MALAVMLNMTNRRLFFFILAIFLIPGCGLFDSSSDRIAGRYIVLWIDLPRNQTISKEDKLHSSGSSTLIGPYVFAVGHNEHYIIAKQHPTNGFEGGYKISVETTNYYIINTFKDIDTVFGPLTLSQFDSLRIRFKIQNLPFDKTYLDNP